MSAEVLQRLVDSLVLLHPTFPLFTDSSPPFEHTTTPAESIEKIKAFVSQTEGKVTIVGPPLVGKSHLFSRLLDLSCPRKPTESLRSRELTSSTTLIDTPPLTILTLFPMHALLGYTNPTLATIEHLIFALDEGPPECWTRLEKLYEIPALMRPIPKNRFVNPAKDLCVHVARKFGRLGKGGPNIQAAVEIITEDCLKGKIRWWVE